MSMGEPSLTSLHVFPPPSQITELNEDVQRVKEEQDRPVTQAAVTYTCTGAPLSSSELQPNWLLEINICGLHSAMSSHDKNLEG